MTALTLLVHPHDRRQSRDRLEILSALIDAPGFDAFLRAEVIDFPPQHPVFAWQCVVGDCERPRAWGADLCVAHRDVWAAAHAGGISRAEFLGSASGQALTGRYRESMCLICPDRPALRRRGAPQLCHRHLMRWSRHRNRIGAVPDFDTWRAGEIAYPGYGPCRALCSSTARSPLGLCAAHHRRYVIQGRPGGARLPDGWAKIRRQERVHPLIDDRAAFERWCRTDEPMFRPGQLSLIGLPALAAAELRWGLWAHAAKGDYAIWHMGWLHKTVSAIRTAAVSSLMDLDTAGGDNKVHMICQEIRAGLRTIYFTIAETKQAGFLETDQFGRRFPRAASHYDLTAVPQRWLRDLLWEYLTDRLRAPDCPRSRGPFDSVRRAAIELGAYLSAAAPDAGNSPWLLGAEHADGFVADQRHRARHGLPAIGVRMRGSRQTPAKEATTAVLFNALRALLQASMTSGEAAVVGVRREFIAAVPAGGKPVVAPRNPFPDEVAQAVAAEANLRLLADMFDPLDRGIRDAWEALILTGRRCNEILRLRLDCIGHYGGLPMLWHDQTKVGNLNAGIRIPERLYLRLDERRAKTLARFELRRGRPPSAAERAAMALFPRWQRNPSETQSIGYVFFHRAFRGWIDILDVTGVPHQARHTLATRLLRHGATLAHIRSYLGQVSEAMAEHYAHISSTDLDDVLHRVWVAGPGADEPGRLLVDVTQPLTGQQAVALAIDLSRRSTPTDGGFCTFQPVVDGGACPWQLNCESCDKFVLSGADLVYWRRKREQWYSIAERAPDDASAAYLHQVFEPTARAIDGLERALAGMGLLDQALAVDLRRPQDYFHRVWSTGFRADDLITIAVAS